MRVLIVDDEAFLADAIATGLTRAGMQTSTTYDGYEALARIDELPPDVVVLDRDLPGVHGDVVCRRVVDSHPATRVIMLTASGTLDDRLEGFGLGADDYLAKPFEMPELVARVRALAKRTAPERGEVYRCGDVRLDTFRREVTRGGEPVSLSPKEFAVLKVLMEAGGGVISAEDLLAEAWDENADPFTNSPRVTVSHLRKKLGEPRIVHTVTGAGYYVAEDAR
ncbi:response regulator transcription factor [Corynebacterium ureicelerivorans]|nr:response regulator transcription factor [Corynebacterium ureicelerivorans]MDN8604641.1 response regulator transcription factor [Corynebacterium ureicelerivorans]